MLTLEEFLRQLGSINPDIQGLAVINNHGLPICSVLARGIDQEITSAMSSAIINVSERAVEELKLGGFKRVLIEGVDGIIILSKAGEKAILCTLAKSDASLGMVFLNIQSISNKIADLMDRNELGDNVGGVPYPYVFKPPSPPGDITIAGQSQKKEILIKNAPNCKFCGSLLPEGQKICHVCGNKVD
ncbi:MAG: roadblock/LC7 domain-containing protein [Candidatus Hermodarchaeota archaeon]